MIGHGDVLVTQRTRSVRHLDDGTAAVGPGVRDSHPQRSPRASPATANGGGSDSNFARYAGTLLPSASRITASVASPIPFRERSRSLVAMCSNSPGSSAEISLGGATERSDAIRRRLRSLQQKRDPLQRLHRVHGVRRPPVERWLRVVGSAVNCVDAQQHGVLGIGGCQLQPRKAERCPGGHDAVGAGVRTQLAHLSAGLYGSRQIPCTCHHSGALSPLCTAPTSTGWTRYRRLGPALADGSSAKRRHRPPQEGEGVDRPRPVGRHHAVRGQGRVGKVDPHQVAAQQQRSFGPVEVHPRLQFGESVSGGIDQVPLDAEVPEDRGCRPKVQVMAPAGDMRVAGKRCESPSSPGVRVGRSTGSSAAGPAGRCCPTPRSGRCGQHTEVDSSAA